MVGLGHGHGHTFELNGTADVETDPVDDLLRGHALVHELLRSADNGADAGPCPLADFHRISHMIAMVMGDQHQIHIGDSAGFGRAAGISLKKRINDNFQVRHGQLKIGMAVPG